MLNNNLLDNYEYMKNLLGGLPVDTCQRDYNRDNTRSINSQWGDLPEEMINKIFENTIYYWFEIGTSDKNDPFAVGWIWCTYSGAEQVIYIANIKDGVLINNGWQRERSNGWLPVSLGVWNSQRMSRGPLGYPSFTELMADNFIYFI